MKFKKLNNGNFHQIQEHIEEDEKSKHGPSMTPP